MELVQITNFGDTPVTFPGNQPVTVDAGATRIVQWDFACAQLGNPVHANLSERQWEYSLVRTWWGFHDGFDSPADWDIKRPKVSVSTLEGVKVYMLIDDPEGVQPSPGDLVPDNLPSDSADTLLLQAQIARQQESINRLEQLLVQLTAPATVDLDPRDTNALATVDSAQQTGQDADASTGTTTGDTDLGELPKPKPTDPAAADAPTGKRGVR